MGALLIKPNFPTLCWRSQGHRTGGFLGRYQPGLPTSQPASLSARTSSLLKRGPGKIETLHQHPSLAPRIDRPLFKHLSLAPCTSTLYQQPLPAPKLAQVSIESPHKLVNSSLQAMYFTPPRTPPPAPSPTFPPGCRPLP